VTRETLRLSDQTLKTPHPCQLCTLSPTTTRLLHERLRATTRDDSPAFRGLMYREFGGETLVEIAPSVSGPPAFPLANSRLRFGVDRRIRGAPEVARAPAWVCAGPSSSMLHQQAMATPWAGGQASAPPAAAALPTPSPERCPPLPSRLPSLRGSSSGSLADVESSSSSTCSSSFVIPDPDRPDTCQGQQQQQQQQQRRASRKNQETPTTSKTNSKALWQKLRMKVPTLASSAAAAAAAAAPGKDNAFSLSLVPQIPGVDGFAPQSTTTIAPTASPSRKRARATSTVPRTARPQAKKQPVVPRARARARAKTEKQQQETNTTPQARGDQGVETEDVQPRAKAPRTETGSKADKEVVAVEGAAAGYAQHSLLNAREAERLPAPQPLLVCDDEETAGRLRCLVLDNDETTGSYQLGSLLFSIYMALCGHPPPLDSFVDEYLRRGGARPGVAELLQAANTLKAAGKLDHIVLYTAASNQQGWVTFLKDALEQLAGVPAGTISLVIAAEQCCARDPSTGRVIKDLRRVCADTSRTIIVDDKPEFVTHGSVIAVTEYAQHVPIDHLVEAMPCSEKKKMFAREALRQDRVMHIPSTVDYTNDRALFRVLDDVRRAFDVVEGA